MVSKRQWQRRPQQRLARRRIKWQPRCLFCNKTAIALSRLRHLPLPLLLLIGDAALLERFFTPSQNL